MPVEILVNKWNPSRKRHRMEKFCYGPLSCSSYRSGAPRKVKGRKGATHVEENWIDEDSVSHRAPDE